MNNYPKYINHNKSTKEQLEQEEKVRPQLFPGGRHNDYSQKVPDWVTEKAHSQTIETLEGLSDGLLYMESDTTVCAQFLDAFEPKKRESYGSFENMFQDSLLDSDLMQQFVNLQGTNPSIIHSAEPITVSEEL